MHRAEGRSWIAAIVFFATAFQALLAPGAAGAPAIDLTRQLAAAATPAADAAPAEAGTADETLTEAARNSHPSPAAKGGAPYCPYFASVFDLAHAAGLLPAAGHAVMQASGGEPREAFAADFARPTTVLDANRARGPPAGA